MTEVTKRKVPPRRRGKPIEVWVDVYNGLLLNPNLDALFDKGYVTFDEEGKILISPYLSDRDREILKCSAELRVKLSPQHFKYLAWHRAHLYWGIEK